ncbi:MAG: phosphatidate cytidylyltransferase, partial [Chloroflexota bacterium]
MIAAVVVGVLVLGQLWLMFVTIGLAILALLAAREVFDLLPQAGFPVRLLPGVIAAPVAVLAMGWDAPVVVQDARLGGWIAVFVAAVVIVLAMDALRRPEVRDGFLSWMGGVFGALYPALLAFAAGIIVVAPEVPDDALLGGFLQDGLVWLLVLVLTVWSFDTFAYLSGRTFKKGRFLNHISPNKTWSGVIGGTVAAMIVAGALTWAAGQGFVGGLVMGLLLAIAGQSGDVAESMLKRTAGAKDSSNLIPGHGGVL